MASRIMEPRRCLTPHILLSLLFLIAVIPKTRSAREKLIICIRLPTNFSCPLLVFSTHEDLVVLRKGAEQIVGEAKTGDLFGEIGVLCCRPQLFIVKTKRLSELLCLNHSTFLNIIQASVGDGTIIMNNLLQTDNTDIRLKAVKLVGDLFSLPESVIHEKFQPIFSEFLKRLTDRVHEVRMSVLERAKTCLLSNPSRPEAPKILTSLCDRLLDYDENIRKQVVAVVCDVACYDLFSVPVETVKLVAERLRDKSYIMERMAEIHRLSCINHSGDSTRTDNFDWIPGKITRCFYDKDFRSDTSEPILCRSLFPAEFSVKERVPAEFSVKERVKGWIRVFSGLDKVEVKALEKLLEQKQRLQQERQRYLSLRQMHQESEVAEIKRRLCLAFEVCLGVF